MKQDSTPESRAAEFLATKHLYALGRLPTESSHPLTRNLAKLASSDLPQASRLLQKVDLEALNKLQAYLPSLSPLCDAIESTLSRGGRIFLCGCGATGRLSLSLELLWRTTHPAQADQVVAFMAGGDVALVHSLEGFEDFPEYGAEQLTQLGFTDGDLFIAATEGGETPFVIGATEEALKRSSQKAFFLYCNPRELLIEHIERSRRILTNPQVHNICLSVGPMALSGSTRMQASTVLQLAIGLCLLHPGRPSEWALRVGGWIDTYAEFDVQNLEPFIKRESELNQKGGSVLYEVEDLAITVFTDTTERSPTFSLPAFNNIQFPRSDHSLAFVMIPSAKTAEESWLALLSRSPRVLNWPQRNSKTKLDYLYGFDFSRAALIHRENAMGGVKPSLFQIRRGNDAMEWQLEDLQLTIPLSNKGILFDHLTLKMILNIHSTLVMGRSGRFAGNFMTYVSPTNGKLVDRAMRYVKWLLELEGLPVPSDEIVVTELFRQLDLLKSGEAVVIQTAHALGEFK
jgi:N-acetylmuramic acid 6-phosphate etherase